MEDVLVKKFQELEEIRKKTQVVKSVVGICIVVIFLLFAEGLYVKINSFNSDLFMKTLKMSIVNSMPVYKKNFEKMAVKLIPTIRKDFQDQFPTIQKEFVKTLNSQSNIFIRDLKKAADNSLNDMADIDFKQLILQAVPQLKNEKNIDMKLDKFVSEYEKELKKRLNPQNSFAYQDEIFNDIQNSLDAIVSKTPKSMYDKNIFDLFSDVYNIVHHGELEKLLKKDTK